MDLHVSLVRSRRLAADAYRQLREAILDGRLRPGDRLPSTRELAERLSVSRNTAIDAYQRLVAEGFLVGRVGAGTFVSDAGVTALRSRRAPAGNVLRPRSVWRALASARRPPPAPVAYDFRLGAPDPKLFPWDEWRRSIARQLRGRRRAGTYPAPDGHPRLRAAIARHLGLSRAVQVGPDDVIVTSGGQQAFDLIARVLVTPGDCVAVEDPGYPLARAAFHAAGARVVPVRVDGDGLDVAQLPNEARLVYVTPSHQFPLGTVMSLQRRTALLEWSKKHGAAIVEDDYDSEFRLDGRPLEPLQSLDVDGRVLYVGSFSKTLLPTLRLGFVVAPASLMPALRAAKEVADSHGAYDAQAALAEFIDDGRFATHVRQLLRVYRDRRAALTTALDRALAGELEVLPASAGLHLSVYFRDRRMDADAVARAAFATGVGVEALGAYYLGRKRSGIALGWGLIPTAKIAEGVARLAGCIRRSARR